MFVGRVLDVWPVRVQGYHQTLLGRRVAFHVTARFKGDAGVDTLIVSGGAYFFERGRSYLVFADRDFTGHLTAPLNFPTLDLEQGALCPDDRRALGVPLAGNLDARSPPAPPASLSHRLAKRMSLIAIVAEIEIREAWSSWEWSDHGAETRFGSGLLGAAAIGWLVVLLRRRRFLLCAWLGLGIPTILLLAFVAWAVWRQYPWTADLYR